MEEGGGDFGRRREDAVGEGEGGEEEFVERVAGVAAVVVNEAEDLVGRGVEEEVCDDWGGELGIQVRGG